MSSPMGDDVFLYQNNMIVRLGEQRRVVSSSSINGGTRTDLRYLFNYSCSDRPEVLAKENCRMSAENLRAYYTEVAQEIGLPVTYSAGMGTAAKMQNHAVVTRKVHGVTVMAIATAGIDVNGGRAGDQASYDEFEQKDLIPPSGTINIMLFIDAKMDGGVLTRAIVTATEAKSAALQELMAPSMYSDGIATGSGTDTIIAVSNEASEVELFDAGKHVILGEMIGVTVKQAVQDALEKQSGMNAERQASIEWQCKRYGITKARLASLYEERYSSKLEKGAEDTELLALDRDNRVFSLVVALIHLCDQNKWGMVSDESLRDISRVGLNQLRVDEGLINMACNDALDTSESVISMIENTLVEVLRKRKQKNNL